jgi:hypothetical protein
MSKFGVIGAMVFSLALAVAIPASAAELRGGSGIDTVYLGSGSSRLAQAGPAFSSAIAHCRQRWAYYDSTSGKYMGDDGQWRPCR